MNDIIGLFFTFFIGIFILVGSIIVFVTKNNNKFIHFSISIAFGVMLSLVLIELLPEIFEIFNEKYSSLITIIIMISLILIGIFLLKLIDYFIPDHHKIDCETDYKDNFYHIGIVSGIALIIHNVIEGMAVFGSISQSVSLGLMISIGVGIHNIPMGMVITSTLYKANKSIKKTMPFITIVALSTFVGGLIMYLNNSFLLNELILGLLLSLTCGILIYIIFFELLPHIIHSKDKFLNIIGVGLGIAIMVGSTLI